MKLIITMRKATKFGFDSVATFTETVDEYGKSYYLEVEEEWLDGHTTLRERVNLRRADYANNIYNRYCADGYEVMSILKKLREV